MSKYEKPEFSVISLESQNDILLSTEQGGVSGDADTGGGEEEE